MSQEGEKCRGETYQNGINMASKWRIDGVFLDMGIENKRGQIFTRAGLLVDLCSVTMVSNPLLDLAKPIQKCYMQLVLFS